MNSCSWTPSTPDSCKPIGFFRPLEGNVWNVSLLTSEKKSTIFKACQNYILHQVLASCPEGNFFFLIVEVFELQETSLHFPTHTLLKTKNLNVYNLNLKFLISLSCIQNGFMSFSLDLIIHPSILFYFGVIFISFNIFSIDYY